MFNPTKLVIRAYVEHLEKQYNRVFGGMEPLYSGVIRWGGTMALENIANSDALYHNLEHTVLVTSVGTEILRGKHITDGQVQPRDWMHFTLALLCHDVGYVRGVCPGDGENTFVINAKGDTVTLSPGATDASLTPHHVERSEIFVRRRLGNHPAVDVETVVANIENTRFPVPQGSDPGGTADYPGLLRAADLIGQLADPGYIRKLARLFNEFRETGANRALGYENPDDLREGYPRFYWTMVRPYIGEALRYLAVTQVGKQWIANLHSNAFTQEHGAATGN